MKLSQFGAGISCILLHVLHIAADECTKVEGKECQCKTGSGRIVDLSNLALPTTGWLNATFLGYTYYFSPCNPLDVKTACPGLQTSKQVSVCQKSTSGQYDVGSFPASSFSGDPATGTLIVNYTGGDEDRQSVVTLQCADTTRLECTSEKPQKTYNFNLLSPLTCAFVPKPSESHSLSTGSILVILFFVFLLVYFIGGVLFLKFVRKAEGLETIPNYEFWKGLPSLIRDGIQFTLRGCKGETAYEKI